MKIKKHFTFSSSHQLWRIILNDTDKLILETRDMNTKEVFFHCFALTTKKEIFKNYQFEEKHWMGIDAVYHDFIFFHKFPKPDMPGHKEILAFDINSKNTLWTNEELSFLFALEDKVYGFKQGFEDRFFYALDILAGTLLEDLGNNYQAINELQEKSQKEKNWGEYLYPEHLDFQNEKIVSLIDKYVHGKEPTGGIEHSIFRDMLLFSFHSETGKGSFDNNFFAIDINSGKLIVKELLNFGTVSLFKDAFFIYKNFLFLLKEKNELKIFRLE